MRFLSGVTDQYVYFVAVDATDLKTRETGLSSFTVYRSRNGGTAAPFTTPTINETDSTNMPGVYELLLDEDMTVDSGDDSQEVALHITHAGMAPVTLSFELYRAKITAGNTLDVASTGEAGLDFNNVNLPDGAIPALGWLESGTMQAGSISTTAVLRAATSIADDLINGSVLFIRSGTGVGQSRYIVDWVSSSDTATVDPAWTTTPDATSVYAVFAAPPGSASNPVPAELSATDIATIVDEVWDEAKSGHVAAGSTGAAVGDIATSTVIADAILDRDMATGTDSGSTTVRTPRQALRSLRNKVAISGGTATVYKEDDTTASWTAAVTTTAGDPISAVDPAGP